MYDYPSCLSFLYLYYNTYAIIFFRRPKTPRKPNGKLKSITKDPIEVYCRIRPVGDDEDQVCVRAKDDKTVVLFPPEVSQNSRVIREVILKFYFKFPIFFIYFSV